MIVWKPSLVPGWSAQQPAGHGFFLFPEETKLSKQGPEDEKEELVERENGGEVNHRFDPEGGFRLDAEEVEERTTHLGDRHAGEGEGEHDGPELPGAGDGPFLFEAGERHGEGGEWFMVYG